MPGAGQAWLSEKSPPDFTSPRLCFFGNLRGNSDLELVERLRDLFDVKIFGRVDITAGRLSQRFNDVEAVSNDLLPQRLTYNTLLLPYTDDEFSTTIAPAKCFEALATGMVILTRSDLSHLPGAADFVFRWNRDWSEAEFLHEYSVRLSVQHLIYEKQRSFARMHSWENRLDAVIECMTGGLE